MQPNISITLKLIVTDARIEHALLKKKSPKINFKRLFGSVDVYFYDCILRSMKQVILDSVVCQRCQLFQCLFIIKAFMKSRLIIVLLFQEYIFHASRQNVFRILSTVNRIKNLNLIIFYYDLEIIHS